MTAIAIAADARGAAAETSAWQQRVDPAHVPKPTVPKETGQPPAKVKSQPVGPSATPSAPLPGSATGPLPKAGAARSLGPSTAPDASTHLKSLPGDDPAYEAFDQGRYLTALDLAQKAAAQGDPQAHTLIARIHAEGLGVPKDVVTAAQWYDKGAGLGDIEAAFGLGVLYAQGFGIERNYPQAARLLEIAAAKGHPLANYNLGLLFLRGQGKAENPHRAFAHIQYAAEKGVVAAQYDLGTMLTIGTGTEANAFDGAKWIGRAARAGHAEAEIEYATILFKVDDPSGTSPAHEKEGAKLFQSAADKGLPIAQNRLARCYAHGKGVAASAVEAAKWHLIAKAGGVEDEALDKLLAKLSKADRLKAEKASADWRDRSQVQ